MKRLIFLMLLCIMLLAGCAEKPKLPEVGTRVVEGNIAVTVLSPGQMQQALQRPEDETVRTEKKRINPFMEIVDFVQIIAVVRIETTVDILYERHYVADDPKGSYRKGDLHAGNVQSLATVKVEKVLCQGESKEGDIEGSTILEGQEATVVLYTPASAEVGVWVPAQIGESYLLMLYEIKNTPAYSVFSSLAEYYDIMSSYLLPLVKNEKVDMSGFSQLLFPPKDAEEETWWSYDQLMKYYSDQKRDFQSHTGDFTNRKS